MLTLVAELAGLNLPGWTAQQEVHSQPNSASRILIPALRANLDRIGHLCAHSPPTPADPKACLRQTTTSAPINIHSDATSDERIHPLNVSAPVVAMRCGCFKENDDALAGICSTPIIMSSDSQL